MQGANNRKIIKKSLGWFLLGFLSWPILAEIIGFISPFWAVYVLDDSSGKLTLSLLHSFQPYFPLVSVVFAYAFYVLSSLCNGALRKIACRIMALVYIGLAIYGLFPKESPWYLILSTSHYFMELALLFSAALILRQKVAEHDEV